MQRTIENVGDGPTKGARLIYSGIVYMLKTLPHTRNISTTNKFDKNAISGTRERAHGGSTIAGVGNKLSLAQLEI